MTWTVAFWNVQRLFAAEPSAIRTDIEDDPAPAEWTSDDIEAKLANLRRVLDAIAAASGPIAILGVCEVETPSLVRRIGQKLDSNLISVDDIADDPARIALEGLNIGLLIDPKLFDGEVTVRTYIIDRTFDTRDILACTLSSSRLDAPIHVYVNHWPSRLTAEAVEKRVAAAHNLRALIRDDIRFTTTEMLDDVTGRVQVPDNSRLRTRADTPVIAMGDFNDEPFDTAVEVLDTTPDVEHVTDDLRLSGGTWAERYQAYRASTPKMFNPYWRHATGADGSYWRSPRWRIYDQILFSRGLLVASGRRLRYVSDSEAVFVDPTIVDAGGKPLMVNRTGKPAGFDKGSSRGCSDHFPVTAQVELITPSGS